MTRTEDAIDLVAVRDESKNELRVRAEGGDLPPAVIDHAEWRLYRKSQYDDLLERLEAGDAARIGYAEPDADHRHGFATWLHRDLLREVSEDPELVTDGGRKITSHVVADQFGSISYGPNRQENPGEWMLGFRTEDDGRVEVHLGEQAMYELWQEVQNVPWPRHGSAEGDLRRRLVSRANHSSEEQLRSALEALASEEVEP